MYFIGWTQKTFAATVVYQARDKKYVVSSYFLVATYCTLTSKSIVFSFIGALDTAASGPSLS